MFEKIKKFIKEVINRMLSNDKVSKAIGVRACLSSDMTKKIEEWRDMYKGKAHWVDNDAVYSLRLEQGICKEFANVTLNEMTAKVSNDKLNNIFESAIEKLNENLQSGLAVGSFIIKPLGENKVEYITADKFVPVEFDSQGRLTKVVFIATKKIDDNNVYHRLEFHSVDARGLTIINKAFHSNSETELGKEVSLESIEEWSNLHEQVIYAGMLKPDFGYYRNPIKNEIDNSFCGVSIFDSAINLIKKADTQFGRLDWEYESGERAVHVDVTALQASPILGTDGKTKYVMPKLNKRLYRGMNLEGKNGDLLEDYSPELRDANFINGLEEYKREIEFNVGLSYGDLSNPQSVEKTATEVKASKKRKYNTVSAIQKNLKECLEDLVYALAFYNALTTTGYEFICNFKDSILVDEETERQQDRQDVSMGVMSHLEYRMKWYGEDEETAKKMLPQQAEVIE